MPSRPGHERAFVVRWLLRTECRVQGGQRNAETASLTLALVASAIALPLEKRPPLSCRS